jgi:hypothetical protein
MTETYRQPTAGVNVAREGQNNTNQPFVLAGVLLRTAVFEFELEED